MRDDPPADSLARWLRQAAQGAPACEPEPADVGTAFGLDLSLLPCEAQAPAADDAAPPNGWLQRLGLPAR